MTDHPGNLPPADSALINRLAAHPSLYLFMDYDGTLAEFAHSPDSINPHPEVIALVERLLHLDSLRLAIISGRKLDYAVELLPIPGLVIAGTYGLELRDPEGTIHITSGVEGFRPFLSTLKTEWGKLLAPYNGFNLEDKSWTLAIHARYAPPDEARAVLDQAWESAVSLGVPEGLNFLHGNRFLEIGPRIASKARAVTQIYGEYPLAGSTAVYLGDDDKDEAGFDTINAMEGISILVSSDFHPTKASFWLKSPREARAWLSALADRWEKKP